MGNQCDPREPVNIGAQCPVQEADDHSVVALAPGGLPDSHDIARRLALATVLTDLSRGFLDTADLDPMIDRSLRKAGEAAGADRAYLFELAPDQSLMSNTHEWCALGVSGQMGNFQQVRTADYVWWMDRMRAGELVFIEDREDLREIDPAEYASLVEQEILSLVTIPFERGGSLAGFVGFDVCHEAAPWSPDSLALLRHLTDLLAGALRRRDTEDALRASEERFRKLVANSFDLVVVIGADGLCEYTSPASLRMLGFRPDEITGREAIGFVHPDDAPTAFERLGRATSWSTPQLPRALRLRHKDGHWVDAEVVASNLTDDPAVRGIVLNVRDISERVTVEANLHEAEARFAAAFEAAPIGMALVGPDERLLRVNRALADLFGVPEESLRGVGLCEHCGFLPGESPIDAARTELTSGATSFTEERALTDPDGGRLWVRIGVSAVYDDRGSLTCYVLQVEDVTARRDLEARLAHEAAHDSLTGLPNRKRLLDELDAALARSRRSGRAVAMLFVDLDGFKSVNDTFGHAAGDELLGEVARRLRHAVREIDLPARFGGDEFAVVCTDIGSADDAIEIAKRVRHSLGEPFMAEGEPVVIGASIGVAVATHGSDRATLMRQADEAAYAAKLAGRNRCELYRDGSSTPSSRRN